VGTPESLIRFAIARRLLPASRSPRMRRRTLSSRSLRLPEPHALGRLHGQRGAGTLPNEPPFELREDRGHLRHRREPAAVEKSTPRSRATEVPTLTPRILKSTELHW
jgi:hypothetical protein